ncbi:hypothetical protein [Paenibacillus glacialis]|uniref:Uncharacterized protein n=1 Tax=Paenibacillus glacialis TaxID=494026 RepID=A0A168NNY3_9BACL|nr:hypothetical protein [Paenibacillus glacialis]OAB45980.1 hypothetical protein PGLA_00865 [Paenibacillus glacialis]
MGTVAQQKVKKEVKKVDRLGRAVVSFIFSFIGLAFFAIFIKVMDANSSNYESSALTRITVALILALVINAISFFLGISARRSTTGRGLAIAAITISAIPLTILVVLLLGTIIFTLSAFF